MNPTLLTALLLAPVAALYSGSRNPANCSAAVIEGDTVVVSSEKVPAPVAVRYAYSSNPDGANLYNCAGLPASPFRTDSW